MEYTMFGQLGQVDVVSDTGLLGQPFRFLDVDHTASGVKPQLTHIPVLGYLVANRSGGTLAAGLRVSWATGDEGPGRAVAGAAGDDALSAGIVDPFISSDVADDSFFFLITHGPIKVQYDGSANLALGDTVTGAASGRTREYVAGTDEPYAAYGKVIEAKTTGSAGDLFRCFVDFRV